MDLVLCLTVNEESDICGDELYQELIICRNIVDESATLIEVLSFLKKTSEGFSNDCIALHILLTIPITSAGAERSFSKLKLIKNYLRNSMSQQRLVGLATLAIEKDVSEKKTMKPSSKTLPHKKIEKSILYSYFIRFVDRYNSYISFKIFFISKMY